MHEDWKSCPVCRIQTFYEVERRDCPNCPGNPNAKWFCSSCMFVYNPTFPTSLAEQAIQYKTILHKDGHLVGKK